MKTYSEGGYEGSIEDDGKSLILSEDNSDIIRQSYIVNEKNSKKFEDFGLLNDDGSLKGNVSVQKSNTPPDWAWANIFDTHIFYFVDDSKYEDVGKMIEEIMTFSCDVELSYP